MGRSLHGGVLLLHSGTHRHAKVAGRLKQLRTYLYKLTSDRGGAPCAPCPKPGEPALLSLAICKPAIRRTAGPGDSIIGLTSRILEQRDGYSALSLIYTGVVSEVLDATAYYARESAFRERPDCIYRYDPESGSLLHTGETGLHADPRHRRRDLGREGVFENGRILLCRNFVYLGSAAAVLPIELHRLREMVSTLGQGHRVITEGKDAGLDAELRALIRVVNRQPRRHTPAHVHADAYDHPAPATRERQGFPTERSCL